MISALLLAVHLLALPQETLHLSSDPSLLVQTTRECPRETKTCPYCGECWDAYVRPCPEGTIAWAIEGSHYLMVRMGKGKPIRICPERLRQVLLSAGFEEVPE